MGSCGDLPVGPDVVDGVVDTSERGAEARGCRWGRIVGDGETGADQAGRGASEEERGSEAELRDLIAVGVGDAFDQTVEPEATQVVAHLALAELLGFDGQERGEVLAQGSVGEASGEQAEEHEGREECEDSRVAEAKPGRALPLDEGGFLDAGEGVFSEAGIVADSLDAQEASIGLEADLP